MAPGEVKRPPTDVYMLPGLGADSRLFGHLKDTEHVRWHPVDWLPPAGARTVGEYAERVHRAHPLEGNFAIGGVSLGGLVAQDWARLARPAAVVLVSTMADGSEMPGPLRSLFHLGVQRWMNKRALVALGRLADRFTSKSPEGRDLFLDMLARSDPDFMRFGLRAAFSWKAAPLDFPVLRIHGDRDRVFPHRRVGEAHTIAGGNHFMVYDRANEVSALAEEFFR